ncbi:MAG: hypothetical protein H8E21_09020 [Gammaproteobacteria bacterium]|nr:hypothetical protein [Gammaproteobacteria bacterium]MBL7001011.1 hypothetical protein [Gammaproteobacteria bacterium]
MKLENIAGLFLFFAAAIIVAIIIVLDVVKHGKNYQPGFKWLTVVLLSIAQVGCWRAMNGLGSAFGNSSDMAIYEIIFIVPVCVWLIFQAVAYVKSRSSSNNSDHL